MPSKFSQEHDESLVQRLERTEEMWDSARAQRGRLPHGDPGSCTFEAPDGCVYSYHLREDGTAFIDLCTPGCEEVVVPESLDGCTVTALGPESFAELPGVTHIVCPPRVTWMGSRVFDSCPDLRKLELPEDLAKFNVFWIRGCSGLDTLYLPGSLKSISSNIFGTHGPSTVRIGRGTREVESTAFLGAGVERLEVDPRNECFSTDGRSLFSADGKVFAAYAVGGDSIEVPDHCTSIGYKAFAYTRKLHRVSVPESVAEIGDCAFLESEVEEVDLPCGIRRIGEKAFYGCRNLERIDLGGSLEEIGREAFAQSGIEEMDIPASTSSIGRGAFGGTPMVDGGDGMGLRTAKSCRYEVDAQGGLYERHRTGMDFVEMLSSGTRGYDMMPGTKRVLKEAFAGHRCIERVGLPEGLEEIGPSAFHGCASLTEVGWPDTLVAIGDEAFMDAPVTELRIPASLQTMGKLPFLVHDTARRETVNRLERVEVDPGNPVFSIENGLLCEKRGSGLVVDMYVGPDKDVEVPESTTFVSPYAMCGRLGIESVTLHRGIEDMGFASIMVDGSIGRIVLEEGGPDGGDAVVEFPRPPESLKIEPGSYLGGRPSAEVLYSYADEMIYWIRDLYDSAKLALARLENPVFMHDSSRARFEGMFQDELVPICRAFAARSYTEGLDKMADRGYIDEGNIRQVIDAVSTDGNTQATGFLLEMERRRFGKPGLDLGI